MRYYYNKDYQVLMETDAEDTALRTYVYGLGLDEVLLMTDEVADEDYYYLHDHLKSPVALLDIDGEVLERYEYDAYGRPTLWQGDYDNLLEGPSWYNNPYYFTGRRLDVIESGTWMIQCHRNRFYDYKTGCWLNQDPIGYQDGVNLYAYVHSNPINLSDPLGFYQQKYEIFEDGRWPGCGEDSYFDAYMMFKLWGAGQGQGSQENALIFADHDGQVSDLMESPGIQEAKEEFCFKWMLQQDVRCKNNPDNNLGEKDLVRLESKIIDFGFPWQDDGVIQAGWNATRQFMGSRSLDIIEDIENNTFCSADGVVRVKFIIKNRTSCSSFFGFLDIFGFDPPKAFDNQGGEQIPMANYYQQVYWYESISCCDIGEGPYMDFDPLWHFRNGMRGCHGGEYLDPSLQPSILTEEQQIYNRVWYKLCWR